MVIYVILLLLTACRVVLQLDCGEIRGAQSVAKFSPTILKTLPPEEVSLCHDLLGKEKLTVEQAQVLWQLVLQVFGSPDQIPEEKLRSLGWIVKGIPPNAFYNMSFTDIDTIAAFGRFFELSFDQLAALRDTVMDQWSSKDVSDLSSFDLANLGHILCAFNVSDISRIHADAYRDAATELSLLKNCSTDVIRGLANLAVNPYAFGDPKKWTALQMIQWFENRHPGPLITQVGTIGYFVNTPESQEYCGLCETGTLVSSIGCVIAGVSQIPSIPSEAFKGVSPDIVDCLPSTFFQSMTAAQLKLLPATSGVAVKEEGLSSKQGAAIEEAIAGSTAQNSSTSTLYILHCVQSMALVMVFISFQK